MSLCGIYYVSLDDWQFDFPPPLILYIYIYIYIHTYTHIHTHIHTYIYISGVYICICMYIYNDTLCTFLITLIWVSRVGTTSSGSLMRFDLRPSTHEQDALIPLGCAATPGSNDWRTNVPVCLSSRTGFHSCWRPAWHLGPHSGCSATRRNERNVLFNNALNTFDFTVIWHQTYGIGPFIYIERERNSAAATFVTLSD